MREILTVVQGKGEVCRQLGERVHREMGEFRRVMADVRAAQGRIEHRLELQGVLIDQTRRELARLTIRQDNRDERLGKVEGEV